MVPSVWATHPSATASIGNMAKVRKSEVSTEEGIWGRGQGDQSLNQFTHSFSDSGQAKATIKA